MDDKGKQVCTRVRIRWGMLVVLFILMAAAATISFLVGNGIGGPVLGGAYVGISMITSLIVLGCFIPGLGIAILAGFFPIWKADILSLFGVTTNFFLEFAFTVTWWFGLAAQIAAIIWIILKILKHFMHSDKMED